MMKTNSQSLNKKTGERIRSLRRIMGLTQAELAGKINVSYQQLQKYERGQNNINLNMLSSISEALGHDINSLIDTSTSDQPSTIGTDALETSQGQRASAKLLKKIEKLDPDVRRSLSKLVDMLAG